MKEETIKGILIDPEKKTIEEVDVTNTLKGLYSILDVEMIEGTYAFPGHVGYVDEVGLLHEKPIYMFSFNDEDHESVLAGRCIIVGYNNEGDNTSHSLDIEHIVKSVTFLGIKNVVLSRRSAIYYG